MTDRPSSGTSGHDRGVVADRVRRQMWGSDHLARLDRLRKFEPELAELVLQEGFGGIYADPRLSLEERSLCTISALAALGRLAQLESHIRAALALGIPPEKVSATFAQLFLYVGLPAVLDGLRVLDEVLHGQRAGSTRAPDESGPKG